MQPIEEMAMGGRDDDTCEATIAFGRGGRKELLDGVVGRSRTDLPDFTVVRRELDRRDLGASR